MPSYGTISACSVCGIQMSFWVTRHYVLERSIPATCKLLATVQHDGRSGIDPCRCLLGTLCHCLVCACLANELLPDSVSGSLVVQRVGCQARFKLTLNGHIIRKHLLIDSTALLPRKHAAHICTHSTVPLGGALQSISLMVILQQHKITTFCLLLLPFFLAPFGV